MISKAVETNKKKYNVRCKDVCKMQKSGGRHRDRNMVTECSANLTKGNHEF